MESLVYRGFADLDLDIKTSRLNMTLRDAGKWLVTGQRNASRARERPEVASNWTARTQPFWTANLTNYARSTRKFNIIPQGQADCQAPCFKN